MTEDYESILKGTPFKTQMDEEDATTLAESKAGVKSAASALFITIDRIGKRIYGQFGSDEQVEANKAVTDMLTGLDDSLKSNSGRIASGFLNGGASQAQSEELAVNGDQPVAVESTQLRELEGQVSELRGNQERLQAEAREVSNLRARVQLAERDREAANGEAASLREQNRVLNEAAQQPNELQATVDDLNGQLTAANTARETAETELTAANERIAALEGEVSEANASATRWYDRAVELGHQDEPEQPAEPPTGEDGNGSGTQGSQPGEPDPAPAPEPEPTPEERRGGFLDSVLRRAPGHRRDQQTGGEQ